MCFFEIWEIDGFRDVIGECNSCWLGCPEGIIVCITIVCRWCLHMVWQTEGWTKQTGRRSTRVCCHTSERILIENWLSKLLPFLVSSLGDIAWCMLVVAIATTLTSEIAGKLCDKVLYALSHLIIPVSEGKNAPFPWVKRLSVCRRPLWHYIVLHELKLLVIKPIWWPNRSETLIFKLIIILILIQTFFILPWIFVLIIIIRRGLLLLLGRCFFFCFVWPLGLFFTLLLCLLFICICSLRLFSVVGLSLIVHICLIWCFILGCCADILLLELCLLFCLFFCSSCQQFSGLVLLPFQLFLFIFQGFWAYGLWLWLIILRLSIGSRIILCEICTFLFASTHRILLLIHRSSCPRLLFLFLQASQCILEY